jgi:hypothetical protein
MDHLTWLSVYTELFVSIEVDEKCAAVNITPYMEIIDYGYVILFSIHSQPQNNRAKITINITCFFILSS